MWGIFNSSQHVRWTKKYKELEYLEAETWLPRKDIAWEGNRVEDSTRLNRVIKKDNQQERKSTKVESTYVEDLLLSLKYERFGVSLRCLLGYFEISSSTFYATTRTLFSVDWTKEKSKRRCEGYSIKVTVKTISDEEMRNF